eukprot:m.233164 g.233164  ORF g.233164 m.233164 type:complete len:462 (+) comp12471_c0_seq1:101-1486(+)
MEAARPDVGSAIDAAVCLDEEGKRTEALQAYREVLHVIDDQLDAMRGQEQTDAYRKLRGNSNLIRERARELENILRPAPAPTRNDQAKPAVPQYSMPPVRSASSDAPAQPAPVRPQPRQPSADIRAPPAPSIDSRAAPAPNAAGSAAQRPANKPRAPAPMPRELVGVDQNILRMILDEVVDKSPGVLFNDIIGLEQAKQALTEIVILPSLRPELFTGLRSPARGVLLFGPPGNGKTMLAKAVASESKANFFSLSASSLTSKWLGESEKIMRALFAVARHVQPSVIFIDEIDSLLTQRSTGEHEASRRLKTEFLVQFDGVGSSSEDRVLVMAATNLPGELDDAALRRFVKRIYIPMPTPDTRASLLSTLFRKVKSNLSARDLEAIVKATEGYSCSDLTALAREAAMAPIRDLGASVRDIDPERVRAVVLRDAQQALQCIRRSVPEERLASFEQWNAEYGYRG